MPLKVRRMSILPGNVACYPALRNAGRLKVLLLELEEDQIEATVQGLVTDAELTILTETGLGATTPCRGLREHESWSDAWVGLVKTTFEALLSGWGFCEKCNAIYDVATELPWCRACYYWSERRKAFDENPDTHFVADGNAFWIGEEGSPNMDRRYGGVLWKVTRGTAMLSTTRLWCSGEVPEAWREQFPDDAKLELIEP